jgi:N-acetylmuramoyl-L-alanine amidase
MTRGPVLLAVSIASLFALHGAPALADESSCANSANAAPTVVQAQSTAKREPSDVPRIELAARLAASGATATDEYKRLRENAARELAGRPDGVGDVSAEELRNADDAIARQVRIDQEALPRPAFAALARQPGRPQIDGLNIIYLNPLGDPAHANAWKNIIVHQTEGPPGSAGREAADQFAHPTKRGVMLWVETDGTVYWAVAENVITTQGEGGDRNDNKYIDNAKTYHQVVKTNSIGVEFIGNFPDVAKPVTAEQKQAWLLLAPFLQERYGIPPDHIYAHNWIDFKDRRYCEGCELATLARNLAYCPSKAM